MGQSQSAPAASSPITPPHPVSSTSASPPPECPMHVKPAAPAKLAECPIPHDKPAAAPKLAACPIPHDQRYGSLNPLNNMPDLPQTPMDPSQKSNLSTERTVSSIPRADAPEGNDADDKWEYPSPQQFYNALVRKGWQQDEDAVDTMVFIHNHLNEVAWQEVLKWENRRPGVKNDAELVRFQGRPQELSPKARMYLWAGWLFPSKYNTRPPFDRHDWVVRRPSTSEEVRYVIDYYNGPEDEEGNPSFNLDVRPALDTPGSVVERVKVLMEETMTGKPFGVATTEG